MTTIVDGVKLNDERLNQIGGEVEKRAKTSLMYLTKMMKGLYSGDMNHDSDFQALQKKIVEELVCSNTKDICKDVKDIVKKEMISVAHQAGSQARMEQARIVGTRRKTSAPEWELDLFENAIPIDLNAIERGIVKVGDQEVINIDPIKLKEDICKRLAEAEEKKIGQFKEKPIVKEMDRGGVCYTVKREGAPDDVITDGKGRRKMNVRNPIKRSVGDEDIKEYKGSKKKRTTKKKTTKKKTTKKRSTNKKGGKK